VPADGCVEKMSNPGQGIILNNVENAAPSGRSHGRASRAGHHLSPMFHVHSGPWHRRHDGGARSSSRASQGNATGTSRLHEIGRMSEWLVSLPARTLIALIWLYRHSLSPVLPVVCGPGCGCRFHPTCAVYAADAISAHGAVRGSWLAVFRLLKCHPWHPGGFDPVPPSPRRSPVCKAVLQGSATDA
jgi:hypothetical protein